MTKFKKTNLLSGDKAIVRALTLLEAGQCVALPTETVYGLAADATNELALEKIFTAKGRPKN
ncbi:L-threonylcarbamoyladenylate synthase, partial [Pseudoalteromonas sp.]|uniref:L-threonylcarbamoyladenylate synthase n=1 Tax=Pseudoalteromonas sp. TaxID=53249 RepID=UPI003565F5CA